MALRRIGEQPIGSLTEGSESANVLSDMYDILLENELRSFAYRWAVKTSELAVISAEDPPDFGYAFQLPADYLQMLRIVSPEGGNVLTATQWEEREDKLYLNYNEVTIKYIFLQTDTSKWDPHFVSAFSHKLAEESAVAISGRDDLSDIMRQKYALNIKQARESNGVETRRSSPLSRDYIQARNTRLPFFNGSSTEQPI